MGKKSKKRMAEAEAMMAEALRIKAEAMKLAAPHAVNANPESNINNNPVPSSIPPSSIYATQANTGRAGTSRPKRYHGMIAIIGVGLLIAAACMYLLYNHYGGSGKKEPKVKTEEAEAINGVSGNSTGANGPSVVEAWEMPGELKEISSIAFIDADRIACVQDQQGAIFIYNIKAKAIEKQLKFGKKGDYEGVVVVGSTFYVLRADGFLIEVSADGKAVKEYDLPLNVENDTEPMFYEKLKNRILVGVKEKDPTNANGKGVYSFDLATKKMALTPVVVLTGTDDNNREAVKETGKGKKDKGKKGKGGSSFNPSEIAIHPKTGEIYALNGPKSEFMIFDAQGKMTNKYDLDKQIFPQPEGLTFSPSGDLYISSEASKKTGGIIARVAFQ
jgi:uncharacterized protein YjiK